MRAGKTEISPFTGMLMVKLPSAEFVTTRVGLPPLFQLELVAEYVSAFNPRITIGPLASARTTTTWPPSLFSKATLENFGAFVVAPIRCAPMRT